MRYRKFGCFAALFAPLVAWADPNVYQTESKVQIATSQTEYGYGPQHSTIKKAADDYGAVALASGSMNFPAGYMTAKSHGCAAVPPLEPYGSYALGAARGYFSDTLFLRSDSLDYGTEVDVSICFDLAYDLYRYASSGTGYDPTVGSSVSTRHSVGSSSGYTNSYDGWASQDNSGSYVSNSYMASPSTVVYNFKMRVGQYVNVLAEIYTSTLTNAIAGQAGKAGASASMTFGAHAPTGTYFYSQNLAQEWSGQCGGAGSFLPPTPAKPVPEPTSMIAIIAALVVVRRRQR